MIGHKSGTIRPNHDKNSGMISPKGACGNAHDTKSCLYDFAPAATLRTRNRMFFAVLKAPATTLTTKRIEKRRLRQRPLHKKCIVAQILVQDVDFSIFLDLSLGL